MGSKKWKYVKRQLEKRDAQNKRSEVYINGVLCPPRTVQTEIRRQGFETAIEMYRKGEICLDIKIG